MASFVQTFLQLDGFDRVKALAKLRDADANSEDAIKQMRHIFRKVGLPTPDRPLQMAETDHHKPKTCFLVVPHGAANGM